MSPTLSPLVSDAASRLRASMPARGTFAIFMSVGGGDASASTAASLRAAFEGDARVVFSRVSQSPGAPVAEPSTGSGHVHAVDQGFDPWPDVVVRVSEAGGVVHIAARPPGADPLGPADQGWTWVLP